MKKRTLYGDCIDILLAVLLIITIILVMKYCSGRTDKDKEQTSEMIHYQQSEGRFAVEENGRINIRE